MAATLIGLTGIALRAQTPEELLSLPSVWDSVFALRGGGGYKDNVFLSHSDPQGSALVSAGADVMVLRLSPYGSRFNFYASADADRFLSTTPVHNEYTVSAQAQLEQDFGENATGWLAAEYFYQDQFLDVTFLDVSPSATNVAVQAAEVRGHTLTLRPGAQLNLPGQFSLALETPVTRQYYDQPLDDDWEAGFKLTLGHCYGHNSQISLSYEPAWLFYDTEPALTAAGAPIPGSHRERFQQEMLLMWRHFWDEKKHWRTTTKLGERLSEENAGGFGDYSQLFAFAQIRYRTGSWEASMEGRVRRYLYDTQTVSATDLSLRRRTEWMASARVERALTKHLKLVASYEYEEILSNDVTETYKVNTVSGSLEWEF